MEKEYCTAVVLAAGSGRRMGTKVHKQYLLMGGKPVLFYSLNAFQRSKYIDEIVLVTGAGEEEYCRTSIVERYGFDKVSRVVCGGAERYHSVWNGLQTARREGYVFIHDGARAVGGEMMVDRSYEGGGGHKGGWGGMRVRGRRQITDKDGFVKDTPDRNTLWLIHTPQAFEVNLLTEAYSLPVRQEDVKVTDDAVVVEQKLHYLLEWFHGS